MTQRVLKIFLGLIIFCLFFSPGIEKVVSYFYLKKAYNTAKLLVNKKMVQTLLNREPFAVVVDKDVNHGIKFYKLGIHAPCAEESLGNLENEVSLTKNARFPVFMKSPEKVVACFYPEKGIELSKNDVEIEFFMERDPVFRDNNPSGIVTRLNPSSLF